MIYKNKLFTSIISLFLVFVILLTLFPLSIFAVDGGAEGGDGKVADGETDGSWWSPGPFDSWEGMRFSLYFAEGTWNSLDEIIEAETKDPNSVVYQQLGEKVDVLITGSISLNSNYLTSGKSVMDRMSNNYQDMGKDGKDGMKINTKIKETMIPKEEIGDWGKTFPELFDMNGDAPKNRWNQFFMGVDKVATDGSNWDKVDLKQTMAIIEKILEGTGITITEENYKNGVFINAFGEVKYGVYKLYFEPMGMAVIGTYKGKYNRYLMTMRDYLAYNDAHPDKIFKGSKEENGEIVEKEWEFWRAFYSATITVGNSVYLITDEPYINMKAISGVKNSGRQPGTNMYDGGGLGVIIGFPRGERQVPQLVKTYVEIESVDADGTIHYKKAAPTTIEDINFYVDEEGNYAPFPLFEQLETGIDGGRIGVLNDIITTPYDLTVTSETEWVDTDFITNAGKELTAISSDIAGYMFGLVTGSEQFIESYTDYVSVNKTSDSAFKSLTDYVEKLLEKLAAVAATTWNLFDFGAFRRSADAEPLVVVSKLTEAVEYTHHLSTEQTLAKLTSKELEELDYTPEIAIVRAGVIDEATGEIVKLTDEYKAILEQQAGLEAGLGISTASNTVVLRYIVKPNPSQVNIVRYFNKDEDGTLTEKEVVVEDAVPLNITGDIVKIEKPISELPENVIGDYTLTKWITNSEYPVVEIEDTLPNKSTDGLEGTTISNILNYPTEPITHNLYVEWKVIIDTAPPVTPSTADVPEWRLSRFVGSVAHDEDGDGLIDYATASMSFTKKADYGCYKNYSDIVDLGTYQFDIVYPNGKKNSGISMGSIGTVGSTNMDKNYENLTPNSWFYSKGFAVGTNSNKITHGVNSASINVDATLNMVKSKDNGSLVLANWITGNGSLSNYSITSGNLPTTYSGASQYNQYADLRIGIYNKQTYTHYYGKSGTHRYFLGVCIYCGCSLKTERIAPNSSKVTYTTGNYGLNVTFDRYIQESTTGLIVAKEYKSDNGLTSLRYQLNNTLNIYPEYGMLFEDESGTETLKWVIGDKARQIKPVVYQTLEHKVYVTPNSNGTSVATDSRGTTAVNALAQQDASAKGKQLIYKGAGVNTSYRLGRSSGSNNTALLTVKTYALDIGNATLKSAWSNSSYNPYSTHSSLITNLKNDNKASITEKLLVDAKSFGSLDLDNANKTGTSKGYNLVSYSSNSLQVDGGNAVCFEHKLIIRGGKLIGIKMMKSDGTYYKDPVTNSNSITIDTLKNVNVDLYNALVNMKLYSPEGKKDDTLLKVFEHRKGKGLNESLYITKLLEGRKSIDNLPTSAYNDIGVVLDKGWYSEDTTVLVVKEYVSNFEVPSVSVSDKLPMTIKNLTTPTNKAQFFSNLAKGYTYLKYNLNFASPSVSGIGDIDVYFEFSSYPFDDLDFGRQGVDYLVPNVSITDTTRLN